MDRKNIVENIRSLIQEGQVTKEELLDIYRSVAKKDAIESLNRQSRISNILYYIGGTIVFCGIAIFVATNWGSLNDLTKIMATLGSAVAMYIAATFVGQSKSLQKVADAFHFVSALVAPMGIFVTLDIAGIKVDTAGIHSVIVALLFAVYLVSYLFNERNVFLVFSVIFGTWLFFGFTAFLLGGKPFTDWDFIKYRWLIAGFSYIFLGYSFADTDKKELSPALYGFGALFFLTAAFSLGGYSPNQNIFWELIFPGLAFGALFLSVYLRERSFLVFGTLFLMIYLFKITSEYFTSGFGWALSLIFVGFALMGIGYLAFYLNKKYLSLR